MTFPSAFLDRLRQRVRLPEVVGRRVRLQRRGKEYEGLCPFHREKTPSFTVNEDKGFFHCFGCGAHGDVVGFVMRTEGLSFPEAVEKLAGEAGLDVPRAGPEERERQQRRSTLAEVVEAACAWFEENLAGRAGAEARAYLDRRGVDRATREAFRLGVAPNQPQALRTAMNGRGIDDDQLRAAGLIKDDPDRGEPRDTFINRLIFPIGDRRGRIIAFGGRTLGNAKAKYLNSPDTELFQKGEVLYNLGRARRAAHDTGELIVAEGYMDVIALARAGFQAAVAPLGTAVSAQQIQELWRLAPEPAVCLDGDEAGRRAGYRLAERALPVLRPGVSLRFAELPAGEDPDDVVRNHGAAAFRRTLDAARPLSDMLWLQATEGRRFDTPERRAGLRRDLHASVREIRDESVQAAYRDEMERRFRERFGGGPPRGRRRGRRGWRDEAADAGGEGVRRPPEAVRRGEHRALLLCLIQNPGVLEDFAEDLAEIAFASADLDAVRAHLVDIASLGEAADADAAWAALSRRVESVVLERLFERDVHLDSPLAAMTGDDRATREAVQRVLAGLRGGEPRRVLNLGGTL